MRCPIVVGIDGSHEARLAAMEAASLSKQSGKSVAVVFIRYSSHSSKAAVNGDGSAVCAIDAQLDVDQMIAQAECIVIMDSAKIRWHFETRSGYPPAELRKAAEEMGAETIIVCEGKQRVFGTRDRFVKHLYRRWSGTLHVVAR